MVDNNSTDNVAATVNTENIDTENTEQNQNNEQESNEQEKKTVNNINTIVDIQFLTPSNAEFSITENGFLQLRATLPNPEKENAVELIDFDRVFLHRAFPFEMPYQYISVFGAFPKPEVVEEEEKEEEKKESEEGEEGSEGSEDNSEGSDEDDSGNDEDEDEDEDEEDEDEDEDDDYDDDEEGEDEDSENEDEGAEDEDNQAEIRESVTSYGDLREIGIISDINIFGELIQNTLKIALDNKYFTAIIQVIYSVKDKYGYSYWDVKTNVGRVKFTVNDTYRSLLKVTDDRVVVNDINGNRYEIPSLKKFDKNSYRKIELFF